MHSVEEFYSPYPFDPPDRPNSSLHSEQYMGKDVVDPIRVVRMYTDLEEDLKDALQDIAATIIAVHPSVDPSNGWVEEKFVIALRQIARDMLEKHKIVY
jgi:hypothetical protein